MRKKLAKIAVIHPQLIPGGGSETCAVWTVEALKEIYDVSLIAMGEINLEVLNEFYGTSLKENEITVVEIPIPRLLKNKFDALRAYKLARFCKKMAPKFDVMFSSYNLMDFGRAGIQYIVDLSFDDELRRKFDPEPQKANKWFYKKSFLRKCYIEFAHILSGFSKDGYKKNITLVVSNWIGKVMKDFYKMETITVYPPIINKFPDIPWDSRENGFLYLGRISTEKQIEKIIKVLGQVRKDNINIHLHIVGGGKDPTYEKFIKNLCEENKNWCSMEGKMRGQEKLEFIAKHKFGMSARDNEASGLAVAEMVKAGCIVFVPNGGGQTEEVGDQRLIYENIEDAVQKIKAVIKNEKLQNNLQQRLLMTSQNFSVEIFSRSVRSIVQKFLSDL